MLEGWVIESLTTLDVHDWSARVAATASFTVNASTRSIVDTSFRERNVDIEIRKSSCPAS